VSYIPGIHNISNIVNKINKKYAKILKFFLNTQLTTKNNVEASGPLVAPIVRHSFGITNWYQEEIQSWI
jgi:hypothetical protein